MSDLSIQPAIPTRTVMGPIVAQGRYDPCLHVGRYIRYWYTYRTAVAVVIAVVLSGVIYWLYTQQVACDTHVGACVANLSVHPEDRFVPGDNPDPNIVIVGIDDQSLKDIGRYPVPRDVYAKVLQTLESDGASVVAFDIGFPDQRDPLTDSVFARALASSTIPVVLGYAGDNVVPGDGKMVQCFGNPGSTCPGVDEIPPRNYQPKQYVSFGDLYTGKVSADKIKGNLILIGAYYLTSYNFSVQATTSAGAGAGTGAPMAGVEMHANVAQMFTPNVTSYPKFLAPEPPLIVFLVILALALLTALAVTRLSVIRGLVVAAVALVVFAFGMATLADHVGLIPDLFHPWLAIGLTYSGVTAYRYLYEDREKRKVTRLFGVYLKPEIVAQLAKSRGGVDDIMRGGERRDVTLLFVDIRGFTSMSESMAAHDVTEVVQMYLDHLSGIIFTWDGTVDKYVGDEIVAFWNAPRAQENHALLAVRCAYDLINRAPELQQRLLAKGLPPVRWGIGVNTGHAVVGNLGSRSRLQYTALGDTVNTAARFCANAPAFHLLIGQPTYDMCKDYVAVDLVPGVQLKGKSAETFRIYQVVAIRETPTSPWVQFPTELAAQAHHEFAQQYTQKAVLAAGNAEPKDILVGEEAQEALADQAAAQVPPQGE